MMKARSNLLLAASVGIGVILLAVCSYAAPAPHYLITNNDFSQGNSATFFTISPTGALREVSVVSTGGTGIDGIGAVATKRVSVLQSPSQNCVFISDAGTNDVAGISIDTLTATGTFPAASTDSASATGLGVVNNGGFVYASFSSSKTVAAYQILSGCKLNFLGSISAAGVNGGQIDDMWAHGNILVASFFDGSIESFDISAGIPASNGDLQLSTAETQNLGGPGAVDITANAHFAVFGGGGSPSFIEVSDISSGKLQPTIVYQNVGPGNGSAGIWLSPDESLLYIANFSSPTTNSNQITAALFDKNTGTVSVGCSAPVRVNGFEAGLATATTSGTGNVLYIAEPETTIGIVNVAASNGSCTLQETKKSPASDPHTITLESIGVFPPRPF
jgi:6-phosphogluconolactonase (cycloisomerase 2 family)